MAKNDFTDEDEFKTEILNFWKYREQKEIVGVFKRFQEGQYGDVPVFDVDGEEVFIPNVTALKTKLSGLKEGNKVKIVYKGEIKAKTGGRMYGDFQVFIK